MRYAFQVGTKNAEVNCDDGLTKEELEVAKEMLVKLIDTRIVELKKQEQNRLPLTADIDSLYPPLSVRALNVLKRGGCNTIGDVLNCTITDLQKMRNMGSNTLKEIQTRFGVYGNFKEQMETDNEQ